MPVDTELDARARALLSELCLRFPLGYLPRLEWRGYRVSAGMAYYKAGVIGLSHLVLKDWQSVEDTLIHEFAHLLAVARHGTRAAGHGRAWVKAMHDLGRPATVRHNYSVTRNARRQEVEYRCERCGKAFLRHRRLPRRRIYVHVDCGGRLRYQAVRPLPPEKNTCSSLTC